MAHRRRRARFARPHFDHGEPIKSASLAPMAGVWTIAFALVLATAYHTPTHALMVLLPVPLPPEQLALQPDYPEHRVGITAYGQMTYDGVPISKEELAERLTDAMIANPMPQIRFAPDGAASYEDALELLGFLSDRGVIGYGNFCLDDYHEYRRFGTDWQSIPMRFTPADPPERVPFDHNAFQTMRLGNCAVPLRTGD